MSRIGKLEINIPDGVEVKTEETSSGQKVTVKGPKGELSRVFRPEIKITQEEKVLKLVKVNESKLARSLYGLSRTLLNNMVLGVSQGFSKELDIVGVGYRAMLKGQDIDLQVGKSHPVLIKAPEGIKFEIAENNTRIIISGSDKYLVGQVAANIRSERPPEPYKGKGIKYSDEHIRRKAGKSGK